MNRVKFGDVVQEIKINVDRTTDDHEYFIAGEHMDSSNIHITRRGRFSESDVGPAFIRLFRPGHVLYGSRRTYLRKVAVADFEGITSNTTFVLETKDSNRLLQELLPYIMLTDRFSEYAINNSKGSTNPYILFKDLAAYEFDLPTIEEQRQLVVLYFQTTPTNFGRGALIIRYTDYQHNPSEPQIYTNYLEANTSLNADTKVSLFEEGDYEVALDYEITEDKLIGTVAHYRIFFKFSIRNGNCMAFPFDLNTGDELTNSSMTDNGFRLDLAKSRYLKVIVKREMLADSADGLVEDTRSNGPAKDGEEYNRDGIYTITVTNQYTNQQTIKKIYVGTNKILRAYMATGLPITEISDLLSQGATINDDGTITMPTSPEESPQDNEQVEPDAAATEVPDDQVVQPLTQASDEERTETIKPSAIGASKTYIFIGVCAAVLVVIISAASHMKRRKQIKPSVNTHEKGGDEQ